MNLFMIERVHNVKFSSLRKANVTITANQGQHYLIRSQYGVSDIDP